MDISEYLYTQATNFNKCSKIYLETWFRSLSNQEVEQLLQKAQPGTILGDKLFELYSIPPGPKELNGNTLFKHAVEVHKCGETALKTWFKSLSPEQVKNLLENSNINDEFIMKFFSFLNTDPPPQQVPATSSESRLVPSPALLPGLNIKTINAWLNENFHVNATDKAKKLRQELNTIFPSNENWSVVRPRGDGFCTLYAIMIDSGLPINNKDYIIDLLIRGTKEYFRHEKSLIGDNEMLIEFEEGDFEFISKTTTDAELKRMYNKLKNLSNTPNQLISFMKYAVNRNILLLTYDNRSDQPLKFRYFQRSNTDIGLENTILFLYNGHTFLLHNKNEVVKMKLIEEVKPLWQEIHAVTAQGILKKKSKYKKKKSKNKKRKTKNKKNKKTTKKN